MSQSPPEAPVQPWTHFDTDGLMVNAYDFFMHPRRLRRCINKGIHDILGFDGPIMLDSGGYQWLRGKTIPYDASKLARFAKDCDANYVMALDFPPKSSIHNNKRWASKNFKNFEQMNRITERVIPVIHAPVAFLKLELGLLSRTAPHLIAFGGLLPYEKGGFRSTLAALDFAVLQSRANFHLLGFAAPSRSDKLSSRILSVDFAGWRNAAAFGYILLPSGYRKVTARNKRGHARRPNREEFRMIRTICNRLKLSHRQVCGTFAGRAILSAYVASKMLF